jgi:hypothetical protein
VLSAKQGKRVEIVWVPGKKSPRTKKVDKLAKGSAKTASARQLVPAEVRRKRTDQPIEIGGVPMHGQEMTIHIFKTEFQRVQGHQVDRFEISFPTEQHLLVDRVLTWS